MSVISIDSKAAWASALARYKFIVVDFYADWCGPCKAVAPRVEALASEYPDMAFVKVNVDELEEIATEYEVASLPTFLLIKNGTMVDRCGAADIVSRVRNW